MSLFRISYSISDLHNNLPSAKEERDVSSLCFLSLSLSLIAFLHGALTNGGITGRSYISSSFFFCSFTPLYLFVFPSLIFLSIYEVSVCIYCEALPCRFYPLLLLPSKTCIWVRSLVQIFVQYTPQNPLLGIELVHNTSFGGCGRMPLVRLFLHLLDSYIC